MKLVIRRWYVAAAIRMPGPLPPLCLGFGLGRYREQAEAAARDLSARV